MRRLMMVATQQRTLADNNAALTQCIFAHTPSHKHELQSGRSTRLVSSCCRLQTSSVLHQRRRFRGLARSPWASISVAASSAAKCWYVPWYVCTCLLFYMNCNRVCFANYYSDSMHSLTSSPFSTKQTSPYLDSAWHSGFYCNSRGDIYHIFNCVEFC